ncbi:MAG: hypothetical protein J7K22_03340 [Nanoarchaeota archaeon]|nr:hypothetical protein [Nanoarchaeota archaeon]
MRIAISSEGDNENARVSQVTGRAPYYLIFDDEKLVEVIKNPFAFGGGGAGFGVAQMLANKGVEVVVSGRFGPNVKAFFDSKKIKTIEVSNISVKEALRGVLNA